MADTGTATVTYGDISGSTVHYADVDWIADASGNVEKAGLILNGILLKLETYPGSPAPTTLYDITLERGSPALDVLNAVGANRSATVAEQAAVALATTVLAGAVLGTYTFKIAAAGNLGAGSARIYFTGG